jgi:uncharacterized protein YndB with AHSA1/START domain
LSTARCRRRIPADRTRVWELLSDLHGRPRWWPGLSRVEGVTRAQWTEVFQTRQGKAMRLDFQLVRVDPPRQIEWQQQLAGTPFARMLAESLTEVTLEADGAATHVTITQRQQLRGYSRIGGVLVRRGTAKRLEGALAGLERALCGESSAPDNGG